MAEFRVRWEIDLDAASPEAAAKQALDLLADADHTATIFEVRGPDLQWVSVDVSEEDDEDPDAIDRRAGQEGVCASCGCDLHEGVCPEGCKQPEGDDV